MRNRLIDLETLGHEDAHKWLDPVEPDAELLEPIEPNHRLRDPIKVAADLDRVSRLEADRPTRIFDNIAAKTAKRDEKLALDPDCNRIVALGYHDVGEGDPMVGLCRDEGDERDALKFFWASYGHTYTRLIGYNSARFDLVVLVMRSLYLGVKHPELVIAPAWKSPHVDLWERLSLGGARRDVKSLRFYAKRLGIPIYDDITGADVAAMVAADEWGKIQNHCLFDLDLTRALAERLGVLEGVTA